MMDLVGSESAITDRSSSSHKGSVLLICLRDLFKFTVRVYSDELLQDLMDKICLKWPEFSPSIVELVFEFCGQQKLVNSTIDLQLILCYAIDKEIPHLTVWVSPTKSCSSSSSISDGNSMNSVFDENLLPFESKPTQLVLTGEGQVFSGGVQEFRVELLRHCCINGFRVNILKNEPKRVTAECVNKDACGCLWRVHASIKRTLGTAFVIKKMESNHSCGSGVKNPQFPAMNSKLVKSIVLDLIRVNHYMKAKDIIAHFRAVFGVELSYYFANEGRKLALQEIYGSDDLSYHQLWSYVKELKLRNKGSHCVLERNEITRRFERVFIAYSAAIEGFKYCRPIVFLDATHLKGRHHGTLLAATTKNANSGLFQLAMAIVATKENNESWVWFMEQMKFVVGEKCNLVFISDRHTGLILSVRQVFPNAHHSFCFWHLSKNLQGNIPKDTDNRALLIQLFHDMAYADTTSEFDILLAKFNEKGTAKAINFVKSLPSENWASSHFEGQRYGELSSALAESFNSWILKERHLPITPLIDAIRLRIMKMFAERRDKSLLWTSKICPEYEKVIDSHMKTSRTWEVVKATDSRFEVISSQKHVVDLRYRMCSCNAWRNEGFPCAHAIRCMLGDGRDIYDFIDRYYLTSMYQETYRMPIEPICTQGLPTSIIDKAELLPPLVPPRKAGRPQTDRIGKSRKRKRDSSRPKSKSYGTHTGKKKSSAWNTLIADVFEPSHMSEDEDDCVTSQ